MPRITDFLSLIKFSHTIFALPFAVIGFALATLDNGELSLRKLVLVVLCMVFARSAAMAFNRWLDRRIDLKNPRTAVREIPSGAISSRAALAFVVLNCLLFVGATYLLNTTCLLLSPIALLIVLGYSYTKRFTYLCHFVLGLGLGLAPIGAYLAVTAQWALLPIVYGAVVIFWVAGFDTIYALQDESFDREEELYSIPVRLGSVRALRLVGYLHFVCGALLIYAVYLQTASYGVFGWLSWIAAALFLGLLVYQHTLVKPNDLSRVNLAFFTTNGVASVLFGLLVVVDSVG